MICPNRRSVPNDILMTVNLLDSSPNGTLKYIFCKSMRGNTFDVSIIISLGRNQELASGTLPFSGN